MDQEIEKKIFIKGHLAIEIESVGQKFKSIVFRDRVPPGQFRTSDESGVFAFIGRDKTSFSYLDTEFAFKRNATPHINTADLEWKRCGKLEPRDGNRDSRAGGSNGASFNNAESQDNGNAGPYSGGDEDVKRGNDRPESGPTETGEEDRNNRYGNEALVSGAYETGQHNTRLNAASDRGRGHGRGGKGRGRGRGGRRNEPSPRRREYRDTGRRVPGDSGPDIR